MQAEVPKLGAEWQSRLGVGLKLGFGLNTGPALCGNTGARQRFKYGPLGHAVNLASRVEGATKQLGVPLLITGSTRAQLGDAFATRRLCRVRVVGIDCPVDLYELHSEAAPAEWTARRDAYEQALTQFEGSHFRNACRGLWALGAHDESPDLPSLILVGRAVQEMKAPSDKFDGVIDLTSK
jgi:adenylate cyclase